MVALLHDRMYWFALCWCTIRHGSFCVSDLVASMRQAELCDWALDPVVFTSLCDSLNRFFTHRGIVGSVSGSSSSLHQIASPLTNMPPGSHPTLSHLTQPSPLSLPPQLPHCSGATSVQSQRKTLTPQSQSQNSQRSIEGQPAASQPLPSNGKSMEWARDVIMSVRFKNTCRLSYSHLSKGSLKLDSWKLNKDHMKFFPLSAAQIQHTWLRVNLMWSSASSCGLRCFLLTTDVEWFIWIYCSLCVCWGKIEMLFCSPWW